MKKFNVKEMSKRSKAVAVVAILAVMFGAVAVANSMDNATVVEVETAEELVELEVAEEVCTDEDCTDCEEVEEVEVETEEVEVTEEVAVETEVATNEKEVAKETTTATTNATTSTAKPSTSTSTSTATTTPSTSNSTSSNTHTCTWKTTTEQVLVKAAYDVTESKTVDVYRRCAIINGGTRNLTLEWEAYCASNGSIDFADWNIGFGGGYTMKSVVVGQETYYNTTTVPAEYKTVSTTKCTTCGAVK